MQRLPMRTDGLKALSVSRPWDKVLLVHGKAIENRAQRNGRMPYFCRYRGWILIHAAQSFDEAAAGFCTHRHLLSVEQAMALGQGLASGALVGRAEIVGHIEPNERLRADGRPRLVMGRRDKVSPVEVDLVSDRIIVVDERDPMAGALKDYARAIDLRWWMGKHGLILAHQEPAPTIVVCKGHQGLWSVPKELAEQLGFEPEAVPASVRQATRQTTKEATR